MQDNPFNVDNVIDTTRFSTKNKALRVIAWLRRFVTNLKSARNHETLNKAALSAVEMQEAEITLIKCIQNSAFSKEIKYILQGNSNKAKIPPPYVSQFNLFLDENMVLRCQTRLNNASVSETSKRPILIPLRSHYAKLLIIESHQKVYHNGTRDTLNTLHQKYWIPRGREMTKQVIRHCVVCKKLEQSPFKTVFCPSLPKVRVDSSPPFSNTGLDFAGPLVVSGKYLKVKADKAYICLFTCLSTRAIHLELVERLEVESFLRAFRRFVGRRGLPAIMYSDNAKTYKSASK